ncbi:MAG: hypothetical protein QE269_03765 [Fimbriimonas sp.]|nr:hypothetical protein [Fimbriimonas sp.]
MFSLALAFQMATAPAWTVGPNLQYQWDGADYLPVGLQCSFDPELIATAKAAGIQDFNIEVPGTGSWKAVADEVAGRRFFITSNTSMPGATGFTVQPQSYRVNGIRGPQSITVAVPGATRAYVVVALTRDASVISQRSYPVVNGVLRADLKAARDSDQVALIYPQGDTMEVEDLWERLDERRDTVLRQIRAMGSQPGLRGIINPLGSTPYLAARDNGFVPTNPMFQREFAEYLEQKYRNLATLVKAWQLRGIDSDFSGKINERGEIVETGNSDRNAFIFAAKLVPLWNGTRGVSLMLNPAKDSTILVEQRKSSYWRDLAECISTARARRVHRIMRSLRKESGAPILQEWSGWSWFFESPDSELSGLTVKLGKLNPSSILQSLSGVLSSSLRTKRPAPLIVTDVAATPENLQNSVFEELGGLGVRGLFVRATTPEQLSLIKSAKPMVADSRPMGFFFPQNALNPASPRKIAGNYWSLPSPADGNRIDLGPEIRCYAINNGAGTSFVMWSERAPIRLEYRFPEAKSALIRGVNNTVPEVTPTKTGIMMTLDSVPIVVSGSVEPPVPEVELVRMDRDVTQLLAWAESEHRDITTEVYEFRNYPELAKTSPYKALQSAQKVHRDLATVGVGYNWLEWERSTDNTFSESVADAGCSNGSYLAVRTPFGEQTGRIHASLSVSQRSAASLEVWIAARIPNPSDRARIQFRLGGQVMRIQGEPVNQYGSGFGWYNIGTTRLPSTKSEFRAELTGVSSTDIALDAVLFSPQAVTPNGLFMPSFILPKAPKKDPKKGSDGL